MKRFLVAPDSFKGTMTAAEVCDIVGAAIKKYVSDAEVVKIPMADGGEGMVASFLNVCGGKEVSARVSGPYFEGMDVVYGILPDGTAVMEMSSCAGLPLVEHNKNPMKTTTFGVGQLIFDAAKNGAKKIILGIGGSATNDCGMGMAAALGYRFLNEAGEEVSPVGEGMLDVWSIQKPEALPDVYVTAACDVDNPLFGPQGAAYVFGPQKGAGAEMLKKLDAGLKNMAEVIRRDLGVDVADIPGAGAAGGLGAAVVAFLGGELKPGIQLLMDAVNFDGILKNTDAVITGEGRIDFQTMHGKVPLGVGLRAKKHGVPCIALCGAIGDGAEAVYEHGITAVFSAVREACDFETVKRTCREDLRLLSEAVVRVLTIRRKG